MLAVRVHVRMGVNHVAVFVAMGVDEVGPKEQLPVRKDLRGSSGRRCSSLLQNHRAFRDVFDNLKLMGGSDDGLRRTLPILDEVDELTLAAGIEHRGRFV